MASERLHGDDTTVPVLALGKCDVGRCWTYVRDDRPFGGTGPPAAMFYYSRDRSGEHPQAHLASYAGILQADAFGGYGKLYEAGRTPGSVKEAACWVHARRPFFAMADLEGNARRKAAGKKEIVISPMAIEIVRRIDALFEIERSINGQSAEQRRAVRQALSAPLVADLGVYMREQCAKLARGHDLAKAMNYILKRWQSFTRFLDDGRVCLSNNAAERALRGIALGRQSWLFCRSDRGGQRAAAMYSLIITAKMNDVDPRAWLADVLARIATHPTGSPSFSRGTGRPAAPTKPWPRPPDAEAPAQRSCLRPTPDAYLLNADRCEGLLRQTHLPTPQAQCLRGCRRSPGRHLPLHRREQ